MKESRYPGREFNIFLLIGMTILFIVLRLPHIGHLLAWDEAWVLCSLKTIAGGGSLFMEQFWRHPPLYMIVGLLLKPLTPGFEFRMECLSLFFTTAAFVVFLKVIARIFGARIALFSGIIAAMIPSALFFDTWVKRDPVVSLFSFLAMWAFFKRRDWLSGLLLGLAFLGKETAVFYGCSLFLMVVFFRQSGERFKSFLVLFGLALAVSLWWYLIVGETLINHLGFFAGSSPETPMFSQPWYYYFTKLKSDLGWPGFILFMVGIVSLFFLKHKRRSLAGMLSYLRRKRGFSLYLLLPAFIILSLSNGKPPWLTIPLHFPLCLMAGIGWAFLMKIIQIVFNKSKLFPFMQKNRVHGLILVVFMGTLPARFNYNTFFNTMSSQHYKLSVFSYEVAEIVNASTRNGDKLLMLPALYRQNTENYDPIFFWKVNKRLKIQRLFDSLTYRPLKKIVLRDKIDWLLLFPAPGSDQRALFDQLNKDDRFPKYITSRAALINVGNFAKGADADDP